MLSVVTRTFDLDPRKADGTFNTNQSKFVVLGGMEVRNIAKADPEKNLGFYTDEQVPILWYACSGSVADQRDILVYEILPDLLVNREQQEAQIVWIPSHTNKAHTNYKTDIAEVLDGVVKLREFNLYHDTRYKVGLGRSWFGWGKECEEINVKVEQFNLSLDIVAFHLIKCRVINLTKFTTTKVKSNTPGKVPIEVVTHTNFALDPAQYKGGDAGRFKIAEFTNRRMRQEIRFYLVKLNMCPSWTRALTTGDVTPPVMVINQKRIRLPIPEEADEEAGEVLKTRAKIRTGFVKSGLKSTNLNLPPIPRIDWSKINIATTKGGRRTVEQITPQLSPENQVMDENLVGFNMKDFAPSKSIQRFVKSRRQPRAVREDREAEQTSAEAQEVDKPSSESTKVQADKEVKNTVVEGLEEISDEEELVVLISEEEYSEMEVITQPNRSLDDEGPEVQMDYAEEDGEAAGPLEPPQGSEAGHKQPFSVLEKVQTPPPAGAYSDISSTDLEVSYHSSDEEVMEKIIRKQEVKMEKERRRYETMLEIRERRHADRHSRMKRLTVTVSADVKARAIAIAKNGPKVMEV